MSKSGSRYGRRSNWFKIHCLLQEQQQNKANNNNSSQANNNNNSGSNGTNNSGSNNHHHHHSNNNSNASANNNTANLLQSDFISQHFLANLYSNYNNNNNGSMKNQEIKRVSSPSDSGASSSADPDENSLKYSNNNNNVIKSRSNSFTEKLKAERKASPERFEPLSLSGRVGSINSLIKPISPFLPYSLHHSLTATTLTPRTDNTPDYFMMPLALPQISITPNLPPKLPFAGHEQHEPMDLSIKSHKRCRSVDENDLDSSDVKSTRTTPQSSSSSPCMPDGPKPVPLDLTLVRTSPLSG